MDNKELMKWLDSHKITLDFEEGKAIPIIPKKGVLLEVFCEMLKKEKLINKITETEWTTRHY